MNQFFPRSFFEFDYNGPLISQSSKQYPNMKKTIVTITATLALATLTIGCGGEEEPTEPTAADNAENSQANGNTEGGDPSNEDSNQGGSTPGKPQN